MPKIILASTSPRRAELMKQARIPFKAVSPQYQEKHYKNIGVKKLVTLMALGKLKSVIKKYPTSFVITADTMVEFGGNTIGKPKNKKHAREILTSFMGQRVDVCTGFAVYNPNTGQKQTGCAAGSILYKNYSLTDMEWYIATKEPFDKAGAHAPQGVGMRLVKKVVGDKESVMGLPITKVKKILKKWKAI